MSQGKILVIRGGAIGDFILTLPVLAALRKHLPNAQFELLGYPHIAGLAVAGGLAERVHPIEARALAGFFARNGDLDSVLSRSFADYHLIVSYLYDPDLHFQDNVARCSKAQFIAGPHRPDPLLALHATEAFLRPLERLAIFAPETMPVLKLSEPDRPRLGGAPALAVHPGSGSEEKNWPLARWSALLKRIAGETDYSLLLVGGEAEGAKLDQLAAGFPAERLRLARQLPLPELAVFLRECAGFVGHDSGISHLAAALGLPGIVLWGPSNEVIWRPHSPRFHLVKSAGGLDRLDEAAVWKTVRELLLPFGRRGG